MIVNIFNIRDERQGTYGTPIFTQLNSEQVAAQYERTVVVLQARVERLQQDAPAEAAKAVLEASALKDCVVYKVGTFDDQSGLITQEKESLVCRISDFFREVSQHA